MGVSLDWPPGYEMGLSRVLPRALVTKGPHGFQGGARSDSCFLPGCQVALAGVALLCPGT